MLNLLVVDDEPIIARGVSDMLAAQRADELIVWSAFSGQEAMEVMSRIKIDILLCDINMGDISGLELQQIAANRWPNIRVIFLTGHDEAQYVREALENEASGYVLKSSGDEKLLQVIDNTISHVLEEQQQLVEKVQMQRRLWQMSRMFAEDTVWQIFVPPLLTREGLQKRLDVTDDPLKLEEPFHLCLMLADGGSVEPDVMAEWMQNLLRDKYRILMHTDIGGYMTLMLQPRSGDQDLLLLGGLMEYIQRMANDRLGVGLAVISCEQRISLEQAYAAWWSLSRAAARQCLQAGETLLVDLTEQPDMEQSSLDGIRKELMRSVVHQDAEQFHRQIHQLMSRKSSVPPEEAWALVRSLLSDLDAGGGAAAEGEVMPEDAEAQLHRMVDRVFLGRSARGNNRTRSMVLEVQAYIRAHLDQDISLTRLADAEGVHPAYLSRVYREVSGQNVRDFIVDEKLRCAQRMLKDRRVRMVDICEAIGMNSGSYFSHFFKKHMGMTPQDYRDQQSS